MLSLLTLSAREGSTNFVHSDPASNYNPLASRASFFNDENGNSFTKEQSTANAWPILCSDLAARRLNERHYTFWISFPKRWHVQQEAD